MSETTVKVALEKDDLSYLIDYLVEDLRVWSEKGFENGDEREQFQRTVSVVGKLREAMGEKATLFL